MKFKGNLIFAGIAVLVWAPFAYYFMGATLDGAAITGVIFALVAFRPSSSF